MWLSLLDAHALFAKQHFIRVIEAIIESPAPTLNLYLKPMIAVVQPLVVW